MTELISIQLNMFAVALIIGLIMGITYDGIRCIRRIIIHNLFFVSLEDFLYWLAWTVIVLQSITIFNYGELRIYVFVAILCGFLIYRYTIGWVLMRLFNYIWCFVRKNIEKVNKTLKNKLKKGRI